MLSCWRRGKKISCQQPTTESPIECCLDMGTKLFCSHPRVSRKEEIYSMLSLFTFLTKATRQELRNRSLPPTPEAEVHSPGVPVLKTEQLPAVTMQPLAANQEPPRVPVQRSEQPLAVRRSERVKRRPKALLDDYILH